MHEQKSKEKSISRYSKKVKKINFKTFKESDTQVEEDLQRTSIEQIVGFPLLNFNKPEVNLENVGFNTNIPNIGIKHREIIAPIVEFFQKTSLIRQIGDFDLNLPDCSTRKRDFTIPMISLASFNKNEILSLDFEKKIPDIRVKIREKTIPIYSRYNRENLHNNYRFNVKVDSIFLKYLPNPDLEDIKETKKHSEKVDPSEDLNPPNGIPDEGFIEDHIPQEILGLIPHQFSKKPVVLFLNDPDSSYTPILELLCQRIYREIEGGFAEPKKITNHKDFMEILNFWLKAEHMIFTIDYKVPSKHISSDDDIYSQLDEEFLRNNLEQLYNQGLGFIIFKNIILDLEKFYPKEHLDIDYRTIEPNERLDNNFEMTLQLCSFLWGLVKPNIDTFYIIPENKKKFNAIFYESKKMYDKILTEIGQPYDRATKRHEGVSKESHDVHYKLKRFVVKYISNELGFSKKKDISSINKYIHTELKYSNKEFKHFNYPDILVDKDAEQFKSEAFEIETLFAEGIKKIDKTIDKYENYPINKLNIVLDNITFLNHIHEIKDLKIMHQHENKGFELEFWTLDLSNSKLINYSEVIKRLIEFEKTGLLPIFHQRRY